MELMFLGTTFNLCHSDQFLGRSLGQNSTVSYWVIKVCLSVSWLKIAFGALK